MSTTLPLFWHLSSASKKERLDASVKLISALEQFQSQKTQPGDESNDDEDEEEEESDNTPNTQDGLDALNAQDVAYSVRRLIRGLASPRESSRLGFAVALTELLSRLDTITTSQILNLILDCTKVQGSMNGQEERDVLFARLFGILSVVQSGLAFRAESSSKQPSASSIFSTEAYEQIMGSLVTLGDQKSWLRESSWFAIHQSIDALQGSNVPWKEAGFETAVQELFVKNSTWSTEKLALALKLQNLHPNMDWQAILTPTFKNADILSSGNLAIVSRILKDSATDEDGAKDPSKAPSGGWKPQLNFSWDIILAQLLPDPNLKKAAKGSFQDFYRIAVDESLFSSTSSANRKYWGFQAFQKALKRVDMETMPMLFTKNFMRTWINHLSKKDRYLHKVAIQTATEVQTFVTDKHELGFSLILQLTGVNGSQQFDKLTKTKTVESILSRLDLKGITEYVDYLLARVDPNDGDSFDVGSVNSRRAWIIEQLTGLVRNHKVPKEDSWIRKILDWLTVHGLFEVKKKSSKSPFVALRTPPRPVFSDDLRQSCRDKLLVCLADLSHQVVNVGEGDSAQKIPAVASDGEFWISKVLSVIQQLEADDKHVALLADAGEEEITRRKSALKITAEVAKTKSESYKGVELLVLGTLLHHYCQAESEEDSGDDALQTCIDGASRFNRQENDNKGKKNNEAKDEQLEPIDLFVDVIIGFLEKGTAYLRTVGNQAFSLLSQSVKESTIELIVTQLERRDPSQLLEDEDEDEETGDDNASTSSRSDDEASGSNSGSEDESVADSNGAEEEADLELRNKIEEALRINGVEPATGETDSEEEVLMDDDQMMAIDEQLAQVFRSRANEKRSGQNVDVQRAATHFKNRVLDLVDTFLKKQPSNPFTPLLLLPLIDLLIGSGPDERQLADKTRGILRSRFGKVKDVPVPSNADQIIEIAKATHNYARKAKSADTLNILSLCGTYVTRVLLQVGGEDTIVELLKEDLVDFTSRKNSRLNGQFFVDFIKRHPAQMWTIRQHLLEITKSAVNAYRQSQVFQMLEQLLNLLPSFNPPNDQVKTFMIDLRKTLLDLAQAACAGTANLSTPQIKELLKLALLGVRQTGRIDNMSTEAVWLPDRWRSLQDDFKTSTRTKSSPVLNKLCERIAHMRPDTNTKSNKSTKSSKRKAEETAREDDATAAGKQKRKKAKVTA
ncbi:DNA polymerase phi-domain-containing protein [Crepidotus variabilis]|uniref:DNA polymerase phi-domain-containing protein n=1 Tax=Crepidotus variabilis TaxID=179855 RepID=A0A9P6EQD0_9AGAR|nr:DNA polymerase phi-domain-containing protein [Crepidotus variabilis]